MARELALFEFAQSTLSVDEGRKNEPLGLKVCLVYPQTGSGLVLHPTITVGDSSVISVSIKDVMYVSDNTQTYNVYINGLSQGTSTVTVSAVDETSTTWTTTATITVVEPTQVIVAEASLENIADSIRDRLYTSSTYKPAQMSGAIDEIGKYNILRTKIVADNKNVLCAPNEDIYTVPSDIDIIGAYGLAGMFTGANFAGNMRGSVNYVDLNNVTEVKSYGLYRFAYRTSNSRCTKGIVAPNLVTAGYSAFEEAFPYYEGSSIEFPELVTADTSSFRKAFTDLRATNETTAAVVKFPKLKTAAMYCFHSCFYCYSGVGAISGVSRIEFPLLEDTGYQAFCLAFNCCENLTSVDFGALKTAGESAFNQAFYRTSSLPTIAFPELTDAGNYAFQEAFSSGQTAITFPKLKNIGTYCFLRAFRASRIASLSLPEVVTAPDSAFSHMFNGATVNATIGNANFPKLTSIGTYGFQSAFYGCSLITSVGGAGSDVSIPLLATAGDNSFSYAFSGCTALTAASFPALSSIGKQAFNYAFQNCSSLTSVSFPAITASSFGSSTDQFRYMLYGRNGVTAHFPAGTEATIQALSGYPNFGGTNTTVLFDL